MAQPCWVVNCSMLLTEVPLLRRAQAARDAGFEAVEFWWPFDEAIPGDAEVDGFINSVADAGVRLTALNFAAGDMAAGERGLLSDPARQRLFRDSADIVFGIAERLGTRAFNALYGNRLDGVTEQAHDETAAANLEYIGRIADKYAAIILLEPLSGIAAYPLRTAADVVAVIDRGTDGPFRLLADLYHLSVNGDDIDAVIDAHVDRIGHVQIADVPGRGAPGTGTLDIGRYLHRLSERGYRGNVSLEYRADAPDPFGWLAPSCRGGSWQPLK